jgi:hypothetical protein
MQEAVTHTQNLSITLGYFATGNNFEDLKFITGSTVLRRSYRSADWLYL